MVDPTQPGSASYGNAGSIAHYAGQGRPAPDRLIEALETRLASNDALARVSRKRVRRLMRLLGVHRSSSGPGRLSRTRAPDHPYLLRDLRITGRTTCGASSMLRSQAWQDARKLKP